MLWDSLRRLAPHLGGLACTEIRNRRTVMQAPVGPQLVKNSADNAKANVTHPKSAQGPVGAKKTGSRFLALLLSALGAWGT
jgi:hypothetical protein